MFPDSFWDDPEPVLEVSDFDFKQGWLAVDPSWWASPTLALFYRLPQRKDRVVFLVHSLGEEDYSKDFSGFIVGEEGTEMAEGFGDFRPWGVTTLTSTVRCSWDLRGRQPKPPVVKEALDIARDWLTETIKAMIVSLGKLQP